MARRTLVRTGTCVKLTVSATWHERIADQVIEVWVLPNIARVASSLRGRGARYTERAGSAVERLMEERRRADHEADPR